MTNDQTTGTAAGVFGLQQQQSQTASEPRFTASFWRNKPQEALTQDQRLDMSVQQEEQEKEWIKMEEVLKV